MISMPFALSETLAPWLRGLRSQAARLRHEPCAGPDDLAETRALRHSCPRRRAACASLATSQAEALAEAVK